MNSVHSFSKFDISNNRMTYSCCDKITYAHFEIRIAFQFGDKRQNV